MFESYRNNKKEMISDDTISFFLAEAVGFEPTSP